jgi:hypothetical protein
MRLGEDITDCSEPLSVKVVRAILLLDLSGGLPQIAGENHRMGSLSEWFASRYSRFATPVEALSCLSCYSDSRDPQSHSRLISTEESKHLKPALKAGFGAFNTN